MGMQYHLTRYAYMYESTVVGEGTMLVPPTMEDGPGLKTIFETIDNRSDFKSYMQNYAVARNTPKGPRREGLYDEGYVSMTAPQLTRQMPAVPHVQAQQNAHQAQQTAPQLPPLVNGNANGSTANLLAASGGPSPASTQVEMYTSPGIAASTGATFGVDLGDQLARDQVEIPKVVVKCTEVIEALGGYFACVANIQASNPWASTACPGHHPK